MVNLLFQFFWVEGCGKAVPRPPICFTLEFLSVVQRHWGFQLPEDGDLQFKKIPSMQMTQRTFTTCYGLFTNTNRDLELSSLKQRDLSSIGRAMTFSVLRGSRLSNVPALVPLWVSDSSKKVVWAFIWKTKSEAVSSQCCYTPILKGDLNVFGFGRKCASLRTGKCPRLKDWLWFMYVVLSFPLFFNRLSNVLIFALILSLQRYLSGTVTFLRSSFDLFFSIVS